MSDPVRSTRYWLEWAGLRSFAGMAPHLSRKTILRLAHFAGGAVARLDRKGRAVALSNLEAAFGGEMGAARREAVVRGSYQNFARTFADLFWMPRLLRDGYRRWMRPEGIARYAGGEAGGGAIFVCQHFGAFEWLGACTVLEGVPVGFVSQDFRNPRLGPIFDRARQLAGGRRIARDGALLKLLRHLHAGGSAAILTDLTLPPRMPSAVVEVFGLKTCVTVSHLLLAERTGQPVVPGVGYPEPDGTARMVMGDPLEFRAGASLAERAQVCWDYFAPVLRRHPELWLWSYKHWRYRPASGGERYPFYANPSRAFDARMAGESRDIFRGRKARRV